MYFCSSKFSVFPMDRRLKSIYMLAATVGLIVFLVAIAIATFIESDYGTPASKIAVYNTGWFTFLLGFLCIVLIFNIFIYKMYRPEKIAVFLFHLAFIVIIIGSGVTRYISFEGTMMVREGASSNIIYSTEPFLYIKAHDNVNEYELDTKHWLSEGVQNPFEHSYTLPNHEEVKVSYVSFKENLIDSIATSDTIDNAMLELVLIGRESKLVSQNEQFALGHLNFGFDKEDQIPGIKVKSVGNILEVQSIEPFTIVDMTKLTVEDRMRDTLPAYALSEIPADTAVRFDSGKLYQFGDQQFMFKEYRAHTGIVKVRAPEKDAGSDFLTVRVTQGDQEKLVKIPGGAKMIQQPEYFKFAGQTFEMRYGAKPIEIPFSIFCRDFQLDRFPGSDMASSFASEVTVIDEAKGFTRDNRIFMNTVMDYEGYRFFQSSYDPDEKGTILSVNHDWWGTNISYLGYLMMAIGMIMSLIPKTGRFAQLNKMITNSRKKRMDMIKMIAVIVTFGFGSATFAQDTNVHEGHDHASHEGHDHSEHDGHDHSAQEQETNSNSHTLQGEVEPIKYISTDHSDAVSSLMVQGNRQVIEGRFIPVHTMALELLRKVHRGDKYKEYDAVQVYMSMHLNPPAWMKEELIYIDRVWRDSLGGRSHVSLEDLVNKENGEFKFMTIYEKAHGKPDKYKNELDKKILKIGERFQVLQQIVTYKFFNVLPIIGDSSRTWTTPFSPDLKEQDRAGVELVNNYMQSVYKASYLGENYSEADKYLAEIKKYQRANAGGVVPSEGQIAAEISYNNSNNFRTSYRLYLMFGLVLLIIYFIRVLVKPTAKSEKIFKKIALPFVLLIIGTFIFHGYGLGSRWYVSGHVPWANGYEAVAFIAWVTIIVGFIFGRKNPAILGAAAILACFMLVVTDMNILDPQITPLRPVLDSYWLKIHVAIITASYAFLGLAGFLGLLNLILYCFKNNENRKRLTMNINELTHVSEMTMTIGLFMLTIGTFLGGVWANESWGRYWAWDPKETWALVSVLTYAVILHLRYIPGLNSKFVFNVVSFWGYSSILFTFFGVNFILVGLHSYAQGDGSVAIGAGWWTAIGIGLVLTIIAFVRHKLSKK